MAKATLSSLPQGWPPTVTYTNTLLCSPAISPDVRKLLHTPTKTTADWPKIGPSSLTSPCPAVRVCRVTQADHPANGQYGLFAVKHLAAGAFVLPYLGMLHGDAAGDTEEGSDYDLSLDRELGVSVDAAVAGNEARFVNDYRGVATGPNAEFRDCWVQLTPVGDGRERKRWERRIGVFVLGAGRAGKRARGIRRGQELLVNYGRSFWKERRAVKGSSCERVSAKAGTEES